MANLTLADLQTEFAARGGARLEASGNVRKNYFLNRAATDIYERKPWPFLETTATGASPLTIADVRQVMSVADSTNDAPLFPLDRRNVVMADPTLNDTGAPTNWYLEDTVLKTWPTTSVSLSVRYLKVPADMSSGSDEPLIPNRYRLLIVDGAMLEAYKDADAFDADGALREDYEQALRRMADTLMGRNYFAPKLLNSTAPLVSRNC